jgi:glycosidase
MKKIFLLLALFILSSQSSFSQIEHLEPMNWWVGMKDENVQLMVNGNDIANTKPVINYAGVSIKKITKGDSKNYLFVDLIISAKTQPGTFPILFTRNGVVVEKIDYTLLKRAMAPEAFNGFNSADIICLITPDRFANGDQRNDTIEGMLENKVDRKTNGARHGGDIRGMINNLDYLKSMGYTTIWPQPLMENNMPAYSYHGYAITDHYKVDPRFGTMEEYKELAQKAKAKGIKLVYDAVLNHIGSGHRWMKDMPFRDWINYADSMRITTHVRTVNQDPNASQYDRELMTKGWFVPTMPDLNGENPFMATYLIQNNIWWIETLQLGGIRLDTYGYSVKPLLNAWACRIMKEYPNFSLVGEEWSLNPLITSYWQKGKKNTDGYTGCLGSSMDFPLQSSLVEALRQKNRNTWGKGLNLLYESIANDFAYADPSKLLIFGDNHDMDRLHTQLGNDLSLTKMAITALLTLRGIPQVYYGTEMLLDNTAHPDDHGYIRADMPGGWGDDKSNAFAGSGLAQDQMEMQGYFKSLAQWRKTSKAIANGKTLHFAPFNDVYVYFRYTGKEKVMVVLNRNEQSTSIDPSRFKEIVGNARLVRNVVTGQSMSIQQKFDVPAKTAMVFEIDPIK